MNNEKFIKIYEEYRQILSELQTLWPDMPFEYQHQLAMHIQKEMNK
jgi:hypothetical protein